MMILRGYEYKNEYTKLEYYVFFIPAWSYNTFEGHSNNKIQRKSKIII